MTIDEWLKHAAEQFTRAKIPSARLDAEVLLCHILGVDRTYLISHGDDSLARTALSHKGGVHPGGVTQYGEKLLLRRLKREPIAYLIGHKEFYGREFIVTRDTLIPRPETEALIELAKKYRLAGQLLDVGTGSGALGLTLALELKETTVTLSDISPEALEIARKNGTKLKVNNASYQESDLLEAFLPSATIFDAIIANLPYVDRGWERSPETDHEPYRALFAKDGGLELIKELLGQASGKLVSKGYLLLEADPEQHAAISTFAHTHGFHTIEVSGYGLLLQRAG